MNKTVNFTSDQMSAEAIRLINLNDLQKALDANDCAYINAIGEIDKIREFVGSPEHILGSPFTKHGEIAERVEVGIRNARAILDGKVPNAIIDSPFVPRTAPHDYIIDGELIQSKFINGVNNNLDHVIEHLYKYPDFTNEGYYHIPKDHLKIIQDVLDGNNTTLSAKSIASIQEKVKLLETESNKSFNEIVKPSISNYSEVQQGRINQTLKNYQSELDNKYASKIKDINNSNHPTIEGLEKAGIVGAVVGGTVTFVNGVYLKYKNGKSIVNFNTKDWEELGFDTAKGSVEGGISASAIYGLTNFANLSAPFAGAVASASKGVGSLLMDYKEGRIDRNTFKEQGKIVCMESAIVGIATFSGQTLIPIPVLGAAIGSFSGQILSNLMNEDKNGLKELLKKERESNEQFIKKMWDVEYNRIMQNLNTSKQLMEAAFDVGNNTRLLHGSINLARYYGVPEKSIIHSTDECDAFMRC